MSFRQQRYQPRHLTRVAKAEHFRDSREPPLRLGDWVCLNSGGPVALVVDDDGNLLTIAWRNRSGAAESTLPRACVHRVCLSNI